MDDDTVVLPLDRPFVKEGRFASLLVRDRELADSLAEGFQELVAQGDAEPTRDPGRSARSQSVGN